MRVCLCVRVPEVCENLGGLRAPIEKAGPPIEESSSLELMDVNKDDIRLTLVGC